MRASNCQLIGQHRYLSRSIPTLNVPVEDENGSNAMQLPSVIPAIVVARVLFLDLAKRPKLLITRFLPITRLICEPLYDRLDDGQPSAGKALELLAIMFT